MERGVKSIHKHRVDDLSLDSIINSSSELHLANQNLFMQP